MNVLLDTHVLLWWLDDHPSLSEKARANIANGENLFEQYHIPIIKT
jgi:PIN domain nuclease of toxin-antitoxin system